jgi:hypothetical protein
MSRASARTLAPEGAERASLRRNRRPVAFLRLETAKLPGAKSPWTHCEASFPAAKAPWRAPPRSRPLLRRLWAWRRSVNARAEVKAGRRAWSWKRKSGRRAIVVRREPGRPGARAKKSAPSPDAPQRAASRAPRTRRARGRSEREKPASPRLPRRAPEAAAQANRSILRRFCPGSGAAAASRVRAAPSRLRPTGRCQTSAARKSVPKRRAWRPRAGAARRGAPRPAPDPGDRRAAKDGLANRPRGLETRNRLPGGACCYSCEAAAVEADAMNLR